MDTSPSARSRHAHRSGVEIDIEIFDVDGVLYVDVFLRDSIEIEQDTTLDMHIGDGSPGGSVEVSQDIEMDQTVDIDIDVEDELEERYVVKVNVERCRRPTSNRIASIDITNWNGESTWMSTPCKRRSSSSIPSCRPISALSRSCEQT